MASKKKHPRKESSDRLSSLASKALRGEPMTKAQIKKLGASVLSQDETKGARGLPKKSR